MAKIDGYDFGRIVVDGVEQTRDVILLPGRVVPNWWRQDGHRLMLDDLEAVLDELPERVGCINSARPAESPACSENRVLAPHAAEALTHPPPFGPVRDKSHFQPRFVSE